jgi:hypothetical protein
MDITSFIKNPANHFAMIVMGRKAGLNMFKHLINSEQDPIKKNLLKDALVLEKKIIKAATNEDQVLFDKLDTQSKTIFAQLKAQ